MTFYNIPWIIPYIGALVHTYKYRLLVYKSRVFHPGIYKKNSSSTYSSTIPHKTSAHTAETIQVLYFDFIKATVLVSLPLDLITLLAPILSGFFIPNKL